MRFTNEHNLPLRIIKQLGQFHKPDSKRISITHLIGCPLERTLLIERWDDVELDYSDFLSTIIGISVHERQDKLSRGDDDIESETKFEDKVGLFTVVGRADNYDNKDKIIRETKVKSINALKYKDFLKEVEKQLNIYAWQRRKRGQEVKGLELDVYFRDWVEWEADKAATIRFAVMKVGRKTAVKTADTKDQAEDFILQQDKVKQDSSAFYEYSIEERGGKNDYPPIPVQHSIPIPLWTFEKQQEFVEGQVEYFTLCPECCEEQCKWRNNLRCKKYCKARSVCVKGKK